MMPLLLWGAALQAQEIGYEDFMRQVAERNAGYLAEKYNVEIAVANAQAAKVFNDPELSFGYSNNQDWSMQMGQSYETEISYTMSLGNVRGARMKVSMTEQQIAEKAAADYLCNLKAERHRLCRSLVRCREGKNHVRRLLEYAENRRRR